MRTHAVIIRMHYQEDDPRFKWRLAYFQAMVLPRLLSQTRRSFDIAVRCYPWHEEEIKSLSKRIITFGVKAESERFKMVRGKKYFFDFVKWDDIIGLKKYDIQTGIDSDDLVDRTFIERVEEIVDQNDKWKSLHLSFQPMIFDVKTLMTGPIGTKYSENRGSAFLSIYQPDKENYRFVYEESHLRIGRHFDRSIVVQDRICWATVHGINESTNTRIW